MNTNEMTVTTRQPEKKKKKKSTQRENDRISQIRLPCYQKIFRGSDKQYAPLYTVQSLQGYNTSLKSQHLPAI